VIVPVPPDAPGPATPPAAAPPAPVAPTPVTPPPAPVVKTPPPERAEGPREAVAPPVTPPPVRYALALGTFPLSEDAERVEAKLNQAGFSTVRFRQQTPSKLFAVQVSSLKDPEEGQATVERLQKEGHPPSVLLVGRTDVTIRVGPPVPLRTAVQLAEKLRAAGYDARVATEPTRAGQVSLRHGNFASRAEAEEASREVARLGVPNEVIQVR
jgi:cell division septation protein DedD